MTMKAALLSAAIAASAFAAPCKPGRSGPLCLPELAVWLDASDAASFSLNTDGTIAAWAVKSAASNASQLLKPYMHDGGSRPFARSEVDGHALVNFSLGWGNSFRSFTAEAASSVVRGLPASATIVWVGSLFDGRTPGDISCPFNFAPAPGAAFYPVFCTRGFVPQWDIINATLGRPVGYTAALESAAGDTPVGINDRVVFAVQHHSVAGTVELWLNGVSVGVAPSTYSTAGATLSWVGSSDKSFNYAAPALHELLAFGPVTDLELMRIMAYEAGKFGIALDAAASSK